jgi:hypothetical protein
MALGGGNRNPVGATGKTRAIMFQDSPERRLVASRQGRLSLCALGVLAGLCSHAIAGGKITRFEIRGALDTWPAGIANSTIAGIYTDALHDPHGFIRTANGTITKFDVPGAGSTFTRGINDHGETAGAYAGGNAGAHGGIKALFRGKVYVVTHGFLREPDGTFVKFDVPDSVSTDVSAINNSGAVAGDYLDGNEIFHGYIRTADGSYTSFDPEGSVNTSTVAINSRGAVAGWYVTGKGVQHGFVRAADGTIAAFDPPDSSLTNPTGINMHGTVTGWYQVSGATHGFIRGPEGKITTFDPPGSNGTSADCIDNHGEIGGAYVDSNNLDHAFIRSAQGKFTTIDIKGATEPDVVSLDSNWRDSGGAAGEYTGGLDSYAFLRRP